jgi:FKBP-type peptidyl-prolyl cis-trans isomerase
MFSVSLLRSSNARALCVLLLALASGACGETPTGPGAFAPFSTQDLRAGTGAAAASGNTLRVNYKLWLYDGAATDNKGAMVDSNVGGTAFTFTLGAGNVIEGWDVGLVGMQEGGLRRLVVPPSQAYGNVRTGSIPPNSTLVFEVELLTVS